MVPNARVEKFEKLADDECRIWVKEIAEGNAANIRMIEIIKHEYSATRVKLVIGHHHASKIVDVS